MSQPFGSIVACRNALGMSIIASAPCPMQYTIESSMIVRYFPKIASDRIAPSTGKKYALATNHATYSRACVSVR